MGIFLSRWYEGFLAIVANATTAFVTVLLVVVGTGMLACIVGNEVGPFVGVMPNTPEMDVYIRSVWKFLVFWPAPIVVPFLVGEVRARRAPPARRPRPAA